MAQVFISYTREHKAQVEPLVNHLKTWDLSVYWDNDLGPGEWEKQLLGKLRDAQIFIVIVTPDVLKRGKGSYVHREITEALEADIEMIVPIVVGELNFERGLDRLSRFEGLTVDGIEDIVSNERWSRFVKSFTEYVAAGGRAAKRPRQAMSASADAVGWPMSGAHLEERQALALSVMMLEGELPFLITDAARELQQKIEKKLRQRTKEEVRAMPRAMSAPEQSALLEDIGARRQLVDAGYHEGSPVIRFKEINHRAKLLEYLWNEQPDVRALLVTWVQGLFKSPVHKGLALHLGRGLTHLAQIDFPGLQYEMLGRLVRPSMTTN